MFILQGCLQRSGGPRSSRSATCRARTAIRAATRASARCWSSCPATPRGCSTSAPATGGCSRWCCGDGMRGVGSTSRRRCCAPPPSASATTRASSCSARPRRAAARARALRRRSSPRFAIHHLEDERKRALYGEILDALEPGGLFANLEHVASPSERLNLAFIAAIGETPEEADPSDRTLDVFTQVGWLRELGYEDADCHWKWREMALLAGVRPAHHRRADRSCRRGGRGR